MKFLADERLYTKTDECLQFLRGLTPSSASRSRPWRCHLYWSGSFSRKQAFAVKSFLATQDLARAELWLWLDAEDGYAGHEENPYLRALLPFVSVKPFDAAKEAAGTPLEDQPGLFRERSQVRRSNLVRFVALFKYGGIYADMDTMFLRDLGVLLDDPRFSDEFCYRWSGHLPHANSAVLGLRSGGTTAVALLERCRERGSCRPRDVLQFDENSDLDLLVLPCPFFDPLWPHRDRQDRYACAPYSQFPDFFEPFGLELSQKPELTSYETFFPGAFTYHWHNCWDARERDNSYFGLFDRQFDDVLREQLGVRGDRR